tara:strand:- start:31 stop:348 length:318 start_codon:yes stop_codon:yes gene_type:complete
MNNLKKSLRNNLIIESRKKESIDSPLDADSGPVSEHDMMVSQINLLSNKLSYMENLNSDIVDFLHTLVRSLDKSGDLDISDARHEFTVLLNRSGRRKFYQQTKRL